MADNRIEGLYDEVTDALKKRVFALGEDATERDFSRLLTEIRALRQVAEQLTHQPDSDREQALVAALQHLTRELGR